MDICKRCIQFRITRLIICGIMAEISWRMAAFIWLIVLSWYLLISAALKTKHGVDSNNCLRGDLSLVIFDTWLNNKHAVNSRPCHGGKWHILFGRQVQRRINKWLSVIISFLKTQINYILKTFKICDTMLGGLYHAFIISFWNVGNISASHWLVGILMMMAGGGGGGWKSEPTLSSNTSVSASRVCVPYVCL